MAMTIGAVQFDYRTRDSDAIEALGELVRIDDRPGLDGHTVVKLGKRGRPVQWTLIKYSSSATNAQTFTTSVVALKGTIISVVDEQGTTRTGILVADCQNSDPTPVLRSGSTYYMTVHRVVMQRVNA